MEKEVRVSVKEVLKILDRAKRTLEGKTPNIEASLRSLEHAIGVLRQIKGGA